MAENSFQNDLKVLRQNQANTSWICLALIVFTLIMIFFYKISMAGKLLAIGLEGAIILAVFFLMRWYWNKELIKLAKKFVQGYKSKNIGEE